MRRKWFFLIPVFIALFIFVGGEIVQHLWNWLLPSLFGWPMLRFWQAVGLLVLARILFGNFGPRGHRGGRCGGRWSSEDREKFREEMRARWGGAASTGASTPGSPGSPSPV
jgi:hypothetical protein